MMSHLMIPGNLLNCTVDVVVVVVDDGVDVDDMRGIGVDDSVVAEVGTDDDNADENVEDPENTDDRNNRVQNNLAALENN
jgi:hypothetical protein